MANEAKSVKEAARERGTDWAAGIGKNFTAKGK